MVVACICVLSHNKNRVQHRLVIMNNKPDINLMQQVPRNLYRQQSRCCLHFIEDLQQLQMFKLQYCKYGEREHKVKQKSPLRLITSAPAQVSPSVVTKKVLTWGEIRQKYIKSTQSEPRKTVPVGEKNDALAKLDPKHVATREDQTNKNVINLPTKIRSKKRILASDTDSSDDKDSSPIRNKRKPQIQANQELIRRSLVKNAGLRQKRNNEFIDDEAVLSGSATEDEFDHTIGQYFHDSVVVDDDEAENESSIPMNGVYLQSLRSPCGHIRGGFKIPEHRQYNDASKIFSQRLPPDNGSYLVDSFIVVSDDESDVEKSMCPLERAEEILKIKRREKRKAKQNDGQEDFLQPAKKKRILRIHNSSKDDGDFV